MQNIRQENVNKLIFAYLNVNLLRNKFDSLVKDKIDFLMISKTKIDDIFPKVQVQIKDFSDPFIETITVVKFRSMLEKIFQFASLWKLTYVSVNG